jgi:hypothetical protein
MFVSLYFDILQYHAGLSTGIIKVSIHKLKLKQRAVVKGAPWPVEVQTLVSHQTPLDGLQ